MNELVPSPTAIKNQGIGVELLTGFVAESTRVLYDVAWSQYVQFAESLGAEVFDPRAFAEWRTVRIEEGDGATTLRWKMAAVRAVIRVAEERGFVPRGSYALIKAVRSFSERALRDSPLKKRAKKEKGAPLTAKQVRAICDAPDVRTAAGVMHRAFLLCLATSGCRIHEVLNLKVRDIVDEGDAKWMFVLGKTDLKPRKAYLSTEAYDAIQAWLSDRRLEGRHSEFVFVPSKGERATPISHETALYILDRYSQGIVAGRVTPHSFRRFVGTALAGRNPKTAQLALGHKDISTTLQYYVEKPLEPGETEGLF